METITGNDGKQEGKMARKRMRENKREKGENEMGT